MLIHQPFGDYYGTYRAMEEGYKDSHQPPTWNRDHHSRQCKALAWCKSGQLVFPYSHGNSWGRNHNAVVGAGGE